MKGKLNIFQQTMLQWDSFHPYNAVGLIRVSRRLDRERLEDSLRRVIERHGIGEISIDLQRRRYYYLTGAYTVDLRIISGSGDALTTVQNEVEQELNRRFVRDGDRINPFRFFAVEGEGCFYLGLVYYHAAADGYSIALIVREVLCRYLDEPVPETAALFHTYPDTYLNLLRRKSGSVLGAFMALPDFLVGLRRAAKPSKMYHTHDQSVGCRFLTCNMAFARALSAASKRWSVTPHDIFLAMIFRSLAPFVPGKKVPDSKKNIALGSIVNISRDLGIKARRTFGVFLSSFTVSHAAPGSRSLEALSKDINARTSLIKKKKRYLKTLLEQWLALKLMPLLGREQQMKFYPKNYPLWGGVTNMNFKTFFDDADRSRETELFAAVSTGPNCPIVFSITRIRESVNIGISFRREVFSGDEVEAIAADLSRYASELSSACGGTAG